MKTQVKDATQLNPEANVHATSPIAATGSNEESQEEIQDELLKRNVGRS